MSSINRYLTYLAAASMVLSLGFSSQALASGSMNHHAMDQQKDTNQEPMNEGDHHPSGEPKSGGHHKKHRPHHEHHHKHQHSDMQKEGAHTPSTNPSK